LSKNKSTATYNLSKLQIKSRSQLLTIWLVLSNSYWLNICSVCLMKKIRKEFLNIKFRYP